MAVTTTHSSRGLNDRWGIKDDRATTFLRSSLSSAFQKASPNLNPIHSDILSSHLFLICLSFSLPVPCPVGSSLQVLLILLCTHTISTCISSQKSGINNEFFVVVNSLRGAWIGKISNTNLKKENQLYSRVHIFLCSKVEFLILRQVDKFVASDCGA